jgi:hypothetical protein
MTSLRRALSGRSNLGKPRCVYIGLALALLGLLTACDVKREWREEVKLANGTVVVIGRSSLRERFGELGTTGYGKFKEEVLLLQKPLSLEWRGDTIPTALEVDHSNVYVMGWLRGWDACERYGYPRPPFAYFRHSKGGGWEQIDPSMAPIGLRPNLLLDPWQDAVAQTKSVINLRTKAQLNENLFRVIPGLEEFRARGAQINSTALVRCLRPKSEH